MVNFEIGEVFCTMQQALKPWQIIVAVVVLVIIIGAMGWFWLRPKSSGLVPGEEPGPGAVTGQPPPEEMGQMQGAQ